jgi:hypothetical protein
MERGRRQNFNGEKQGEHDATGESEHRDPHTGRRSPLSIKGIAEAAVSDKGTVAPCAKCGQHTYVMPLHDERGGPLFCFMCAGAWHAEHGPRRRARRVVIKALKAFKAAGGSLFGKDFDELKLAASGFVLRAADNINTDFADLTSELLAATIALTHPDKHPPERKAEANRVTQELQALKPFVFPAPQPEPPPKPAKPRDGLFDTPRVEPNKPSQPDYPCDDCLFASPRDYCDSCKAQHDKEWEESCQREEKKRKEKNARQRELYSIHKEQWLDCSEPIACAMCDKEFEPKRSDAKYCSAACRQRAYVKRDGKVSNNKPLRSPDIKHTLEILFTTNPDGAFTTDELCAHAYCLEAQQIKRKHRVTVLPIAKKIICEQFETWDWWRPRFSNCGLVFWNRVNLISTALSNLQTYGSRYDSDKKRRAAIAPGGDYHERVVEGGWWWDAWQEDVAHFKQAIMKSARAGDLARADSDSKKENAQPAG